MKRNILFVIVCILLVLSLFCHESHDSSIRKTNIVYPEPTISSKDIPNESSYAHDEAQDADSISMASDYSHVHHPDNFIVKSNPRNSNIPKL